MNRPPTLADALESLRLGQRAEAEALLHQLTQQGYGRAAYELARQRAALEDGQAQAEAEALYAKAAELGFGLAAFNLAVRKIKAHELADAKRWYERAAALGEAEASLALGTMAIEGDGETRHEFERARGLFERAAARGVHRALIKLGHLYARGDGVEADPVRALRFYLDAIEQGEHAQAEAADQVRYCERDTSPPSLRERGRASLHGVPPPSNRPQAVRLLEAAAAAGDIRAPTDLARLAFDDPGAPLDAGLAHLATGAERGDPRAQLELGELLLEAGDVEGASFWFALLADGEQGSLISDRAAGMLGRVRVGSAEPAAVHSLLERGAAVADPICMMTLGAGLTAGVFGPPEPADLVSGARWLIKAHASGVTGAVSELQQLIASLDQAEPGLGFQIVLDGEMLAGGTGALALKILEST